jgi:hypothetical protein
VPKEKSQRRRKWRITQEGRHLDQHGSGGIVIGEGNEEETIGVAARLECPIKVHSPNRWSNDPFYPLPTPLSTVERARPVPNGPTGLGHLKARQLGHRANVGWLPILANLSAWAGPHCSVGQTISEKHKPTEHIVSYFICLVCSLNLV